jgi:hypothetical protein
MKTLLSLPHHPFTERHHPRRRRGRHETAPAVHETAPPVHEAAPTAHRPSDLAVQRVRNAGGPLDQASYTCMCGYVFLAPVSTTVRCPHCHAAQAW